VNRDTWYGLLLLQRAQTPASVQLLAWTAQSTRSPARWWACLRVWEVADVHPRVKTLPAVWPRVMRTPRIVCAHTQARTHSQMYECTCGLHASTGPVN
jgi:hypothetical protein